MRKSKRKYITYYRYKKVKIKGKYYWIGIPYKRKLPRRVVKRVARRVVKRVARRAVKRVARRAVKKVARRAVKRVVRQVVNSREYIKNILNTHKFYSFLKKKEIFLKKFSIDKFYIPKYFHRDRLIFTDNKKFFIPKDFIIQVCMFVYSLVFYMKDKKIKDVQEKIYLHTQKVLIKKESIKNLKKFSKLYYDYYKKTLDQKIIEPSKNETIKVIPIMETGILGFILT